MCLITSVYATLCNVIACEAGHPVCRPRSSTKVYTNQRTHRSFTFSAQGKQAHRRYMYTVNASSSFKLARRQGTCARELPVTARRISKGGGCKGQRTTETDQQKASCAVSKPFHLLPAAVQKKQPWHQGMDIRSLLFNVVRHSTYHVIVTHADW